MGTIQAAIFFYISSKHIGKTLETHRDNFQMAPRHDFDFEFICQFAPNRSRIVGKVGTDLGCYKFYFALIKLGPIMPQGHIRPFLYAQNCPLQR